MKKILLLVIISTISFSNAQHNIEAFYSNIVLEKFDEAETIAIQNKDLQERKYLLAYCNIFLKKSDTVLLNDTVQQTEKDKQVLQLLIKGYQISLYNTKNDNKAFEVFSKALDISEKENYITLKKLCLIAILDLYKSQIFIGSKQYKYYLEAYRNIISTKQEHIKLIFYELIFYSKANDDLDVEKLYYNSEKKLDSIFKDIPKNHSLYYKYSYEKAMKLKIDGIIYQENYEDTNREFFLLSSKKSLKKALDILLKLEVKLRKNSYLNEKYCAVLWQLSDIYLVLKDLVNSKIYIKKCDFCSTNLKDLYYNDLLKSKISLAEKKHDSAYFYLNESLKKEYKLGYKNNTLEAAVLTVQNETDKLKLDKLKAKAKQERTRSYLIAALLVLLFGSITAFLIQKNTKRKQKLAEQEKALETQKLTTVLKEQELTSIDAMIAGQEKERQRIANDLHDDLGGLMANVKLHFNALKEQNSDELFNKTNTLIDEAYQKVRTVAHAKNSGVIANQGLLKAIKEMANKISASNKIAVEVIDHGLNERLKNSLELTLFRIIQELITNVIKHAEATEATIHLTNHDDSLNIMVEDNGKGFNTNQITTKNKGMGISSIDKRVEHLNGSLNIESAEQKGTTVIIDIPL